MNICLSIYIILITFFISTSAFAQYTPGNFFTAARSGDTATLQKALNNQKLSQEDLNMALGAAVVGNQITAMKLLIKKGADVNHTSSYNNHILINAITHDSFLAAETLIKEGADVNVLGYNRIVENIHISWDWTPLMCAAYKGNLNLVKLLVTKGAKINEKGKSSSIEDFETATDIAAYSGHLETLKFLLSKKGELNPQTVFKVARAGHLDTLKHLLKINPEFKQSNFSFLGKTLLMEACWWGQKTTVQYLIDNGANINQLGENGYTALSETIRNASDDPKTHLEIVKILLEHGANVNLSNPYKMTPLQLAVDNKQEEMVQLLTQSGAK